MAVYVDRICYLSMSVRSSLHNLQLSQLICVNTNVYTQIQAPGIVQII